MKVRVRLASNGVEHTTLYLSGSSWRGERHVLKHWDRLGHVGILLSYNDLRSRGSTYSRLTELKGV